MANPAQVKTKTDMGLRERLARYLLRRNHLNDDFYFDNREQFPATCQGYEDVAGQIIQICVEKLSERFNSYLDERILDCSIPPLSENHRRLLDERRETFRWVKLNFARIVQEIQGEH